MWDQQNTNLYILPSNQHTMSYGCHPAVAGLCDCDWKTFGKRRDEFVQCNCCADLWKKYPEGTDWKNTEQIAIENDALEVIALLQKGDIRPAFSIIVERNMLWRSSCLFALFQTWLPLLSEKSELVTEIGDLLEICSSRIAPR